MNDDDDDEWFDQFDWCCECIGYGDDYYRNEDGELIFACDDCYHNEWRYCDD